jgi:hypothetical protein
MKKAVIHIPKGIASRGGCRVGWQYYASEADALAARPFAKALALQMEEQGYYWGYAVPGYIMRIDIGAMAFTEWPYGYLLRDEDKALTADELRVKYPVIWELTVP